MRNKLIEIIQNAPAHLTVFSYGNVVFPRGDEVDAEFADHLIASGVTVDADANKAIPIDEWHEDDGYVLWWRFPIVEPPYVGSPYCGDWKEDYYTHWTPIACPEQPMEGAKE